MYIIDSFEFEINTTSLTSVILDSDNRMNMTGYIAVGSGTHNVTELATEGWDLKGYECVVYNFTGFNSDNIPVGISGNETISNPSSIDLDPWQAAECTFTNDNSAWIKIIKEVNNTAANDHTRDVDFELSVMQL